MTNSNSPIELPPHLAQRTVIVLALDMTLATRLGEQMADDRRMALYFDGFYHLCGEHLQKGGGQIIKFIGDSCLAVFPEDAPMIAVEAAVALRDGYREYRDRNQVRITDLRIALHIGEVVIGQFGPLPHHDVLGRAVGTAFIMVDRPGITLSEALYRKLPSDRRSSWHKRTAPTVYTLE